MKSGIYLNDFIFKEILTIKNSQKQKTLNRIYTKLIWLGLKTYKRLPEHAQRKLFENESWRIQQEIENLPIEDGKLDCFVTFRVSKQTKETLAKIENQSALIRKKIGIHND